jgi:hypothetical protein
VKIIGNSSPTANTSVQIQKCSMKVTSRKRNEQKNIYLLRLYVEKYMLDPFFMTIICKKGAQDFHRALSKVFDRMKTIRATIPQVACHKILYMYVQVREHF